MSRSRRKLDTSPIEYDDVVDSPALKGMVSFLEVPPGQLPRLDFTVPPTESPDSGIPLSSEPLAGLPVTETPVSPTPDPGTPASGIPASSDQPGSPSQGAPILRGPAASAPQTGIPHSKTSESGTPVTAVAYPPVLPRPTSRIRRAVLAQDGHSFGEQALYEALWQHAHPHGPDTRIVTIGYRRMSELARLTVNNCKANIQALIQKLAVEEVASFTHSQGRTYLVYSYTAILGRRREAGLTHYIKSRGVAFVDPDTGEPLTVRLRDRSGVPFSGPPVTGAVPEWGATGAPEMDASGTPVPAAAPYSEFDRNSLRNPSSSTPPELTQGLREIVDYPDDEAAAVLWRQCRRRAPDCTPAEVLHFARGKAGLFRSGRIQNPTGFLLAVVPKCFEGASFAEYRQEQARLQQIEAGRLRDAEEQMRQMRREFQAILEDPSSSEEDRRFVRQMLEGN